MSSETFDEWILRVTPVAVDTASLPGEEGGRPRTALPRGAG